MHNNTAHLHISIIQRPDRFHYTRETRISTYEPTMDPSITARQYCTK